MLGETGLIIQVQNLNVVGSNPAPATNSSSSDCAATAICNLGPVVTMQFCTGGSGGAGGAGGAAAGAAGAAGLLGVENVLAQPDVRGGPLHALVVGKELQRLLQPEQPRRDEPLELLA